MKRSLLQLVLNPRNDCSIKIWRVYNSISKVKVNVYSLLLFIFLSELAQTHHMYITLTTTSIKIKI